MTETKTLQAEMDHMRADMRAQTAKIDELQAQNQLLLSKISALSSQNSNAPGIFDGADRRKLEEKHAKLRESGKEVPTTVVRQRQLAFFDMQCKFFGQRVR